MSHVEEFYKKRVPVFGFIIDWMVDNDMDYGHFVFWFDVALLGIALFILGVSSGNVIAVLFAIVPIWLPIILFLIFFYKWTDFKGVSFYLFSGRTTLRIKLPQEVLKSPEAMEFVFSQMHNVQNPDNLMQTYLDGKRPLPFSLELVSIGGEIRFYMNVPSKKSRDAVEAHLYAQYPGVVVEEEPVDYAGEIPIDGLDDYELMAFHMGKKKSEVQPIKTYVDFKLNEMPKEEEKVDPMTSMLEILAATKPGERLMMQWILIPYRPSTFKNGQLFPSDHWEKSVRAKIDELMQRDPVTKAPLTTEGTDFDGTPRITTGERDAITAMERNLEKYPYFVGLRWIYITPKGEFNGNKINQVIRTYSQYDKLGENGNGVGVRWRTDFDYMFWSDPTGKRLKALKRQELKEYKMRKYYPKGAGADDYKIFTAEELATMFHLPGKVALTPNITRIESTRSEAPSNLPFAPQSKN